MLPLWRDSLPAGAEVALVRLARHDASCTHEKLDTVQRDLGPAEEATGIEPRSQWNRANNCVA